MTSTSSEPLPPARGRTTQGREQLELEWTVPPATAATPDLVCWLWAAFPPRDGRLQVSRIATALGVPTTTMRRWIHAADSSKLSWPQIRRIHQRAILRGHGHYLWPDLDPVSRRRAELVHEAALGNTELIDTEPDRIPPEWHHNGTLEPHEVHLVHFERAHVYGVASTRHDKALAKIRRFGEVLETRVVPHKYAAVVLKHEMLARVDEHRCVAPRALVPTGRTETWREIGGPTGTRRPLAVTVVRFAGLRRFDQVAEAIAALPNVTVTPAGPVHSAAEACEALTQPADVVILTSHGYTRRSWSDLGTRRAWPGGSWYAGDRRAGGVGMSLPELLEGVRGHGGLAGYPGSRGPRLVVIDAGEVTVPTVRRQLRTLTAGTPVGLALKGPQTGSWAAETAQLAHLVARAEQDRETAAQALLEGQDLYQTTT